MRAHNQSNGDPADSVDDHVTATTPRRTAAALLDRTDHDASRWRLGNPKHQSMVKVWSMPLLCFAAGGR
jgi:hypothetical protein